MKVKLLFLAIFVLSACGLSADDNGRNIKLDGPGMRPKIEVNEDVYLSRRHDDVVIENEEFAGKVTISPEGDLFIDDDKIRTSKKEKELLVEYYELANAAFESAEKLGEEGVKIGVRGAELGIKAATGVFKILLPGYTTKDFEKEMEEAAEKVEKKAEKLEIKADKLEKMLDHLEDIHDELRDSIEELDDLGWF
ncbi:hypothetical protein EH222_11860 [candidate division KSB1 bacterium]|nr:MAG: hypothetical protein EH222_11860 [candidate division KSB1 bacterium]